MCIRALDYCPAVDITFGEYLRALITADIDAFPDDPLHYRLAFMESFRKWKLLPRDVRTVSEETLAWSKLDDPSPSWLNGLLDKIDLGWNQQLSRSEIFALNEKNRWALWTAMKRAFATSPDLYAQFGLLPDLPRYNEDGSLFRKAKKGKIHLRCVQCPADAPDRARRLVPHRSDRRHPATPADRSRRQPPR